MSREESMRNHPAGKGRVKTADSFELAENVLSEDEHNDFLYIASVELHRAFFVEQRTSTLFTYEGDTDFGVYAIRYDDRNRWGI